MAYEQKDMEGALFKNDRRRDGKQDAHARGSCMIGGVQYWIDAWTNERDGNRWQKLKFRPKADNRPVEQAAAQAQGYPDEVPF